MKNLLVLVLVVASLTSFAQRMIPNGTGSATVYFVPNIKNSMRFVMFNNKNALGKTLSRQYLKYECSTGEQLFWVQVKTVANNKYAGIKLNIEAGKSYYIKVNLGRSDGKLINTTVKSAKALTMSLSYQENDLELQNYVSIEKPAKSKYLSWDRMPTTMAQMVNEKFSSFSNLKVSNAPYQAPVADTESNSTTSIVSAAKEAIAAPSKKTTTTPKKSTASIKQLESKLNAAVEVEDYEEADRLKQLIDKKNKSIKELEIKLQDAVEKEDYEAAQKYQDLIDSNKGK